LEFGWPEELQKFRADVNEFAASRLTPAARAELRELGPREARRASFIGPLLKEADGNGWLKRSWPREYGGEGATPWYLFLLRHELQYAGIPPVLGTANMIVPAILKFGTPEQKAEIVPKVWSGEWTCALGYSEPDAGTDLASLSTRATRDGDDFVVNGQKAWTSGAHNGTHLWLAVRTDPAAPKHRGISVLLVPLDSPGITIRPTYTVAGARTNEVFFDDVRVPATALIGEENNGWYIIANALDHERVTVGVHDYVDLVHLYEEFVRHLELERPELLQKPTVRMRLAEALMELNVHRALLLTNVCLLAAGETPTAGASAVKIWSSELRQRLSGTFMELLGRFGALNQESEALAPADGLFEATYRWAPVVRFAGGTNEVQRDIIAQRGLGLPR
jgi:alkylation response protein AidB-like acyl-CoA dehydrogenase